MSGIMLNITGGNFAPNVPTVIGQAFGGGYYTGQISTAATGIADYYLIVGPSSSATNFSIAWKTSNTSTGGTSSVIDGPTNSANMNNASHPAAQFCEGLAVGGFSDWYMPAKNELEICYRNLKPTTTGNNTSSGANANAVPSTGSYSGGNPAQTSASLFQTGNSESYAGANYWSSTEFNASRAWNQYFLNGNQRTNYDKTYSLCVRAVRRIAV